jgi:hypothetical protein
MATAEVAIVINNLQLAELKPIIDEFLQLIGVGRADINPQGPANERYIQQCLLHRACLNATSDGEN